MVDGGAKLRGKYKVFGLVIDTPVLLPEAMPVEPDTKADVKVTLVSSIDGLSIDEDFNYARETRTWWFTVMPDCRTLFNCSAGLFEIKGGVEVNIFLYPDAEEETIKIFLLGSAMGAIQIQRGRIPIHGGAVVTKNGAMIITGKQGSGKSTMTSAFVHNGYKYITDDVSSIIIDNEQAFIIPAYPQRKLVRDACDPLGFEPDNLIQVDIERDKFAVRDKINWQSEPVILSSIIELYPGTYDDKITAELVTGRDKLNCVTGSLYRSWMHLSAENALQPTDIQNILKIASQADIFRIKVPRNIAGITSIAKDIAEIVRDQNYYRKLLFSDYFIEELKK